MVVMYRPEATEAEQVMLPPPIEGDPDVAARVHRVVLRHALLDPDIHSSVAAMLANFLKHRAISQAPNVAIRGVKALEKEPEYELKWSPDRQWLTLEFSEMRTVPPKLPPPNNNRPSTPPAPNGFPTVKANPATRPTQTVTIRGS